MIDIKNIAKNPHFNFENPGNSAGLIEKYYSPPGYQNFILQSIERVPVKYNIWFLNRFLNPFETDEEKKKGLTLFREIAQETPDNGTRDLLNDF
jgi:hypothetical protein